MTEQTDPPSGDSLLPVPQSSGDLATTPPDAALMDPLERDYLMIAIFVRIQHLRFAEAYTLINAVLTAGVLTPDLLFAKAVVENAMQDHEAALATVRRLEKHDPAVITDGSKATKRARMRAYIKARACFALNGSLDDEAKAALEFYLRYGRKKTRTK